MFDVLFEWNIDRLAVALQGGMEEEGKEEDVKNVTQLSLSSSQENRNENAQTSSDEPPFRKRFEIEQIQEAIREEEES